MKRILLFSLCLITACAKKSGDSSTTTVGPTSIPTVAQLNSLAQCGPQQMALEFTQLNEADAVSTTPAPSYCPGVLCNCPAEMAGVLAFIGGQGNILAASFNGAYIESVIMGVTFDPTQTNGETCLELAQDALINGLPLYIYATVTVVPLNWTPPLPYGNEASSITQLYQSARQASAPGTAIPAPFSNPWAGLMLTNIISCAESLPNPPTQPVTIQPVSSSP